MSRYVALLGLAFLAATAVPALAADGAVQSFTLRVTLGDLDSTFIVEKRAGGALLSFRRSDGIAKSVALSDRDWRDILTIAEGPELQGATGETCPRRSVEITVTGGGSSRIVRACAGGQGGGAGAILMRLADALGAAVWMKPAEA